MIGLVLAVAITAVPLQVIQPANAQDGRRVRLVARSDSTRPIVGVLGPEEEGRFSVRVTNAGTTVSVAPGDVAQLSVSRGINHGSGARKGYLVGVGVGTILFAATYKENSEKGKEGFGLDVPLAAIAYFGLLPLPFAAAGWLLAGEQWEPITAPTQQGVGGPVMPTSIRFAANERVRARTGAGMHDGAVSRATPDSLMLVGGEHMAWREVSTLSVLSGRSRAAGAMVGGGIGLGIGIAAGAGSPSPDAWANVGFVVLTTAVGAILGSKYLRIRQWMSLPIPK